MYGFRSKFDPRNGIHQNFTLELPSREYSQLKITLRPEKGCEVSKIEDIQTEFVPVENPNTVSSLCTGKPYVTSDSVPAQYPDATGRELMDGVTSGNWEKYVGWNTNYVSAELFAENEVTFDEIRVYTLEDLSSGIHLPEGITCLSTRDATAERGLKGFGAFPAGFEILDEFHYDPALSAMVGHFSRPVTASHVRLLFQKDGWLFLSEIQFCKDGELLNSAPWRYTLSPQAPSARERGVQYGDDGKMLTDGKLSTAFSRDALGVYNGQTVSVTIDLQRRAPIHRVVAHVLDGGSAGITLPRNISVQISSDGQIWDAPACLFLPESEKLPELVVKSAYADVNHPSVRYIRLNMTARTWAFLTEVEVR